jgi:uncharacterized membrane protein YphA (DoxX/SURF4 family)
MTARAEDRVVAAGRIFFALGIVGLGAQHLFNADFIPVIVPGFPTWMPGRNFWTCVAGAGLMITGGAMLIGKGARASAFVLGTALLAALVLLQIPDQSRHFISIGIATNAFKELTLAGGALVVAASASRPKPAPLDRKLVAFGCLALGLTCAVFGIDHFVYEDFVVTLVPSWMPGQVFWTYFCGAALVAAAAGMVFRILPRLASALLGAMIFIWLIVLHIPRALADPHGANGNEWTSVFEALSFSGIAFMLAVMLPKKRG